MLVFLQIVVYDGNNGELITTLGGEKAHNGGIYAVSRPSMLKDKHFWFDLNKTGFNSVVFQTCSINKSGMVK